MAYITRESAICLAACCSALAAAVTDRRSRKIPNWLVGTSLCVGASLHLLGGARELIAAVEGGLFCGFVFLIFYKSGGIGAGDVKLMAAQGCMLGLQNAGLLLISTAITGGVIALVVAVRQKAGRQTLRNVIALSRHHKINGCVPHPELNVRNSSMIRLPYAYAIATGVLTTIFVQIIVPACI